MFDVTVIEDPAAAEASLDPVRARLLAALAEPGSATTLAHPSQQSIGNGATLAQRCAICHGPTGVSQADSPNLAGQYASVIYKQLFDFRSGARSNAVMTPFAENLSDQDIADLAQQSSRKRA